MLFDWQMTAWQPLLSRREQLPHALLLSGRPGLGISLLAETFAQSLLCQAPGGNGLPCMECQSCNWFAQGNHPDYRLIQPDSMAPELESESPAKKEKKRSDQIRIEQIRALEGFLAIGTHRGGLRIIVLDPADAMNLASQSALLKSLEEPPPATLFLLVSSRTRRLLPTVRSRCQILATPLPPLDLSLKWLEEQGITNSEAALAMAAGAPIAALEAAQVQAPQSGFIDRLKNPGFDPIALAQLCDGMEISLVLGWLQRWAYDLLSVNRIGKVRYHPHEVDAITELANRMDSIALTHLLHRLSKAMSLSQHPLNAKLFFEDIFLEYRRTINKTG